MSFKRMKSAVEKQFANIIETGNLFRVDVERDELWKTYLNSFPEGTNPIYRERTEHDCSACRQFIKSVGGVVTIKNGEIETIWDDNIDDSTYSVVMKAMAEFVRSKPIANKFLNAERKVGVHQSFEGLLDGNVKTWNHFFIDLPSEFVVRSDLGTKLSEYASLHDVMLRSLQEITTDSVDTVLDLIAQKSLYRGDEHKFVLDGFVKLKKEAQKAPDLDLFVWEKLGNTPAPIARMRNTVIGTLLDDLSKGMDLEAAVKIFESKVAPANYKRPKAIVTKAMIQKAKEKIVELGLESALERRYAVIDDISINDIIFANRETTKILSGDVFDELAAEVGDKPPKNLDKVESISIDQFLTQVVPRAESIELFVENRHIPNFMSLIAPVNPTSEMLFKWNNRFSWCYNGELADSIKERVKKAGGNVSGDVCCRLAWYNYDDLDLHMEEPNGTEIYFGNRKSRSTGGQLDVDMNASRGESRNPVENIFYTHISNMKPGKYRLFVRNYCKREKTNVGFDVEVDILGDVHHFSYSQDVSGRQKVTVLEFKVKKDRTIKIIGGLQSSQRTQQVWSIPTQTFHQVSIIMNSPNHWKGSGIGNKHYFFMIPGCTNDGTARGFFNEFLKEDLTPHRKVMELVGSRMKTEDSPEQLSGLGFSSTKKDTVLCRVKGSFTRNLKIIF